MGCFVSLWKGKHMGILYPGILGHFGRLLKSFISILIDWVLLLWESVWGLGKNCHVGRSTTLRWQLTFDTFPPEGYCRALTFRDFSHLNSTKCEMVVLSYGCYHHKHPWFLWILSLVLWISLPISAILHPLYCQYLNFRFIYTYITYHYIVFKT